MMRKLLLAAMAAFAMAVVDAPAEAAPISANNPYRSFNLSGVNYGSMRWERAHRASSVRGSAWGHRGGGLLFRRR